MISPFCDWTFPDGTPSQGPQGSRYALRTYGASLPTRGISPTHRTPIPRKTCAHLISVGSAPHCAAPGLPSADLGVAPEAQVPRLSYRTPEYRAPERARHSVRSPLLRLAPVGSGRPRKALRPVALPCRASGRKDLQPVRDLLLVSLGVTLEVAGHEVDQLAGQDLIDLASGGPTVRLRLGGRRLPRGLRRSLRRSLAGLGLRSRRSLPRTSRGLDSRLGLRSGTPPTPRRNRRLGLGVLAEHAGQNALIRLTLSVHGLRLGLGLGHFLAFRRLGASPPTRPTIPHAWGRRYPFPELFYGATNPMVSPHPSP